jgi:tripartite-type tricarboxylate transporter receptor subunit TctC
MRAALLPITGLTALLLAAPPASAQQSGDNFWGRELSVYIGSTPGGGYDQYGRLLARHIARHLPGTPTVVPRNMPAAGGREVMNFIYNVAPKDGTAIAITLRDVGFDPLFNSGEAARFDAQRLTWIGSMNSETSMCVSWADAPFRSFADVQQKELIIGSSGEDASDSVHGRLLNQVAGAKFKIIYGYNGSTAIHLAMERGEVQGRCGLGWDSILSRYKHWLDEKKIVLLSQMALDKHPDLPNVPWGMELARTERDKQMTALVLAPNKMGRPIFAPPGVPADRTAVLRRAFAAVMQDPQLIADADKMTLQVEWLDGAKTEALVKQIYATPRDVIEATKKVLSAGHGG